MLTLLMSGELVAARQAELIADAEAGRLALRVLRARRDGRRPADAHAAPRTRLRPRPTTHPARP